MSGGSVGNSESVQVHGRSPKFLWGFPCRIQVWFLILFHFSPCSGLVIAGYSKTSTHKSTKTHLAKAMAPYKTFKKMYMIDKTGVFKGKKLKSILKRELLHR